MKPLCDAAFLGQQQSRHVSATATLAESDSDGSGLGVASPTKRTSVRFGSLVPPTEISARFPRSIATQTADEQRTDNMMLTLECPRDSERMRELSEVLKTALSGSFPVTVIGGIERSLHRDIGGSPSAMPVAADDALACQSLSNLPDVSSSPSDAHKPHGSEMSAVETAWDALLEARADKPDLAGGWARAVIEAAAPHEITLGPTRRERRGSSRDGVNIRSTPH